MGIISEGKHKDCVRGFIHTSEAWYRDSHQFGPNIVDEVMFGFYAAEGRESTGEMAVRWKELCSGIIPQLQVFDDAWHALYQLNDVLGLLSRADNQNISPATFCELLLSCGFVDMTERVRGDDSWKTRI